MNEIDKCEVCGCGKNNLISVLDLGNHPMCDDLVPFGDTRICEEYPIEILFCQQCKTAHQRYQIPKKDLFKPDYHYRARMTPSVLSGMSDLVDSCEKRFGDLSGKKVLDIGCNDGSLLDFFKEKGCQTIGIEPTNAAKDSKHETINSFFDSNSVKEIVKRIGKPDFITFTNVFAHIENLPLLISNLKLLINEETVVVIENHYLGSVFEKGQFDTFYHEHPRTYSYKSFEYIAKSLNRMLLDAQFVSRYGGNIRVFIGNGNISAYGVDESHFENGFFQMQKDLKKWKKSTKKMIKDLTKQHGKMRAKAFPGRAAILIKLLGLNESHLSAVYEIKGSIKVHHYIPGTRIPILPEADLYALETEEPIINLAWHIPDDVRANLQNNNFKGSVIDIK